MHLREAVPGDAHRIHAVFVAAIRHLAADAYSPLERAAWAAARSEDAFRESLSGRQEWTLVAEEGGRLVGFGSLLGREIQMLYVHPDAAGKGVGSALLAALEKQATALGHHRLRLRASLNAEAFYASRGYTAVERGVRRLDGGISLGYVWMEKTVHA
ncbi:MAG TPA: GNAT family N-acetyltransferase [Candidatus Thermoplasmatota archaeon]|nr:GNAT family N-acetyltransferase [Candidatus Thermoplasmatota archaeon]